MKHNGHSSRFFRIDSRGIDLESPNYKVGWADGFGSGLGVGVVATLLLGLATWGMALLFQYLMGAP